MPEMQNDKPKDLCANPKKRENAIKLFNDIFRVEGEEELYYFFPAGDILSILSDQKCVGIKVHPALVDNRQKDRIDITMIIKPLIYNEDDFKRLLTEQSNNSDNTSDYESDDTDTDADVAKLADNSVCCPTTGRPVAPNARTVKIETWIDRLRNLL